jgi:uncharacterized protein HemX
MDQMDTSQSPFPQAPTPRSGNIGPLAAAVVIVVLLAAGGFYFFWSQQQRQSSEGQTEIPQQSNQEATTGDSSVNSIEADLNSTQTSGGSSDVDELNSSL